MGGKQSLTINYEMNLVEQSRIDKWGRHDIVFDEYQINYLSTQTSNGAYTPDGKKTRVLINFYSTEVFEIVNSESNIILFAAALGSTVSLMLIAFKAIMFGL